MPEITNLYPLLTAIDGVEDIETNQTQDEDNYTLRYRGVKFKAYSRSNFARVYVQFFYRGKAFSERKARAALVEWGEKLVPESSELEPFFLVTHYSDCHGFSFPFNKFDSETIETILSGFVDEFPDIIDPFSKNGQVEFSNRED